MNARERDTAVDNSFGKPEGSVFREHGYADGRNVPVKAFWHSQAEAQ